MSRNPSAAEKVAELKQQGYTARVIPAKVKGRLWYRSCVGTFKELSKAHAQALRVRKKTKYKTAFAIRIQ